MTPEQSPHPSTWLLLTDPTIDPGSVSIYKTDYPSYIFHLKGSGTSTTGYQIIHDGHTYYIEVCRDVDNFGTPPPALLLQLLMWYESLCIEPSLKKLRRQYSISLPFMIG